MAVGRVAVANFIVAINQDLKAIYPNEKVDSEYLVWLIESIRSELEALSTGSTVKGIRLAELLSLKVFCPNKQEQTQIATILSTIDRAIEQTEALIAKQQRIKTGLMQDLLTKGIDENGNIRSEETHEFKDSPLGRIPVEWEVKRLGEIGEFANGVNKSKEHFGFGTKFVNISDVYPDHLDVYLLSRINVSKIEIDHYGVEVGDILMDRSSVKLEGVGYPTVFEGYDEPVVFCGFIIRFRPLIDLNSRFICLQMRDESFRIEVLKVATQSANVNVNQESLSQLYIKLPSKKEQDLIVNKERKIDMYLECLNQHLLKLRCNKTGLMQDLLTGKVRVTELIKERETDNL
jgi:type I restriction enzyme S subunit